ncbi:hypothetical protein [Bacillus mesophilum]|uniref:N-acetyltransferase domain-containing protein n=1 Tax=Bacillus mesophilum TaxID=1071718 RepID=A0A7V7RL74_9BACI|nr:hypothetical protein [Bacillus mesophilum]KAB2332502.1 hypothetical protein F7732_10410 [Bacillus mesophilum]
MNNAEVRCAGIEDVEKLSLFLQNAKVSSEGIKDSIDYFLLSENDMGQIQASLGIEPHGQVGLLRSLVLSPNSTEKDMFILLEQILMLARDKGLTELYMASNKQSAALFFTLMGFQPHDSTKLPADLYESEHVKHILSVDNSYFLKFSI